MSWYEPEGRPEWVNALLALAVVAGSLWIMAGGDYFRP